MASEIISLHENEFLLNFLCHLTFVVNDYFTLRKSWTFIDIIIEIRTYLIVSKMTAQLI